MLMLKNYLLVSFRNFQRHRAFTLINLLGLSIGLAGAILTYLFIEYEFSFDAFHTKAERIFRVVAVEQDLKQGIDDYTLAQPYPLGPALQADLPEVATFVRTSYRIPKFIKQGNEVYEEEITFADSTLFQVFSFPLVYGQTNNALNRPHAVAISEKVANKYFGDSHPIGQMLSIRVGDTFEDYQVTAVFEDIPANSSLRADVFLPMMKESLGKDRQYINDPKVNLWHVSSFRTYVLLHEEAAIAGLAKKMSRLRNRYYPTEAEFLRERKEKAGEVLARAYVLQNIRDIHLDTVIPDHMTGSKPVYSYVLAGVAACILLLAIVNFTLLSVSRAHSRAKEVGIRKVVGALRSQLMGQFWSEALLISFLALLLALAISVLALPSFSEFAQKPLSFRTLGQPASLLTLGVLPLLTGLLAGAYPALLLAGLDVQAVFKNKLSPRRTGPLPHLLLSTQFVLPLVFLTIATVMIAQLRFMREKDLGFQTEQIVVIENKSANPNQVFRRFEQLAQRQPTVRAVTATDAAFTRSSTLFGMRLREEDPTQFIRTYDVMPNFFEMLAISLKEGRAFREDLASDSTDAIVVNEAFTRAFNLSDPVGQEIGGHRIIGVVEDFHFQSLADEVAPLAFYLPGSETELSYLLVQLQNSNPSLSIPLLATLWKEVAPDLPFRYSFLDEDLLAQYEEDARWSRILQWISTLSVFIAAMGLLGVVGLAVVRRTKEIGIRKVLGASVHSLLLLFSNDYLRLVLIALAVAIPIANYFITEWLQNFANRIEVHWWFFLLPGLLLLTVVLLVVTTQILRAAQQNPVDSLRYE